jgi:hypothetical protein
MARIRSVHPGQWTDENFVSCSPLARLLAIGLRNEADDNGVFQWRPLQLKMRLLPADNTDVSSLLAELVEARMVYQFASGGQSYGLIRNFVVYQRPKKPTYSYPTPEHKLPQGFSIRTKYGTGTEPVRNQDGTGTEDLDQRREGEGRGGEEEGEQPAAPPSADDQAELDGVTPEPCVTTTKLVQEWNEMAQTCGIPLAQSIGKGERCEMARARLADPEWLRVYYETMWEIPTTPFLTGQNDRHWKANLTWFVRPDSVLNIQEGKYAERENTTGIPRVSPEEERRLAMMCEEADNNA